MRQHWGRSGDSVKPRSLPGCVLTHAGGSRRKIITKELQPRLWAYLRGIGKNHQMIVLAVSGTDDHVHILFHWPPKLALAKAVLLLKANSSKWMTEADNELSLQEGYGSFIVSSSSTDSVIQYIKNQEKHHRKFSFEEEFSAILQRPGVEQNVRRLPN